MKSPLVGRGVVTKFAKYILLICLQERVYLHHPPFTASVYSDDPDVKQYLVPLFEQAKVDMVFAGHSHIYERYLHQGIHYVVTGGGGVYLGSLAEDLDPPVRIVGESVYHHCVVDVNVPNDTFALSVLRNDRTEIDSLLLQKEQTP